MADGVAFLNCGTKHGIHLIVSLASLRKHYKGPVAIMTGTDDPGLQVCEWITADGTLGSC